MTLGLNPLPQILPALLIERNSAPVVMPAAVIQRCFLAYANEAGTQEPAAAAALSGNGRISPVPGMA
jgi:hypothetical protein